jgi:5-methylcytosine-specific restriction endonuclease McrA
MLPVAIVDNEKKCSKCGEMKPLEQFYFCNTRGKRSPYTSQCKSCLSILAVGVKERAKKPCPSCGVMIHKGSQACKSCAPKLPSRIEVTRKLVEHQKSTKQHNFCIDCGVEIGLRGERCVRCRSFGALNASWKGGMRVLKERVRELLESRQWRSDVFTRDKFTCQDCGCIGGKLQAHHIIPVNFIYQKYEIATVEQAIDCSELWNLNNGVTLCKECHLELHKRKGYKIRTP